MDNELGASPTPHNSASVFNSVSGLLPISLAYKPLRQLISHLVSWFGPRG